MGIRAFLCVRLKFKPYSNLYSSNFVFFIVVSPFIHLCVFHLSFLSPFFSSSLDYGFVEFQLETDADYALKIMNMVKVYNKPMRCNKAAQDKRTLEVGANLFIGNLDPEVDDQLLFDTFSSFGNLLNAKVSEWKDFQIEREKKFI